LIIIPDVKDAVVSAPAKKLLYFEVLIKDHTHAELLDKIDNIPLFHFSLSMVSLQNSEETCRFVTDSPVFVVHLLEIQNIVVQTLNLLSILEFTNFDNFYCPENKEFLKFQEKNKILYAYVLQNNRLKSCA